MRLQITTPQGLTTTLTTDEPNFEDFADVVKGVIISDAPCLTITSRTSVTIIGRDLLQNSIIRIEN